MSMFVLPTPQSPIIINFNAYSFFFDYMVIILMSALKQKRQQLAKEIRQQSREQIREKLRNSGFNRLCGNEMPLISTVLQLFWNFNHFQLTQHSQEIMQTIQQTNFQQLSDEEHEQIVTDLFYLVNQNVLKCSFMIKFKKNQSPYTASLAAYLSADLEADQLLYWLQFMCEQDQKLAISMVEGDQQCQRKWVQNKKLFLFLLQKLKWYSEAAQVYKSMITNCDQLSKKDIDLSVQYIFKAITFSQQHQNEQVGIELVSILLTVLEIYFKMKQNKIKILQLVDLLKKQLSFNNQFFTNSDILADLNKLYEAQPDTYLGNDENCEQILAFIQKKLIMNEISFEGQEFGYYLNNLFRMFYNQWLSTQLRNKGYRFPSKVNHLLEKLGQLAVNNVWFIKLRKLMV